MSNEAPPPFGQRMLALTEPGQIMVWAMKHYIRVFSSAVLKGQLLAPFTQTHRLRDEAFGSFWIEFSSPREMPQNPTSEVPPPVGSSALIPPLLRTASGIVLDIGPGTGTQMPLLKSESITALYGAEPCTALHSVLRAKAEQEGISHKYHILPTGVAKSDLLPALAKSGMELAAYEKDPGVGVFDTILCVRVLCSVPEMEKTVGELYGLLKPGGRLLVTEHVVNSWRKAKGSFAARAAQWVYGALGWSWFIGDCALDRDTESVLRGAAGAEGWESVELERNFEWSAMPYLSGVLTKKG